MSEYINRTDRRGLWMDRANLLLMLACAGWMLYWSGVRLFWYDELLSYFTDTTPTAAALLRVQKEFPVSLDPPFFHLLGHWFWQAGLPAGPALRFTSMCGIWLMMASVFLFTRRLAGSFAASLSVAGILLLNLPHVVEARPYGVLLGTTASALFCWQQCLRAEQRKAALAGLFLSLSMAINSHYFGILVAVPLLLAELRRSIRRRKVDWPVCAAMLASYGFVLGWLPFLKGAGSYRAHYYLGVSWSQIGEAYLPHLTARFASLSGLIDFAGFLLVLLIVAASVRLGILRSKVDSASAEWLAVALLALLPVFGFALALFTSGAFARHYVLEFSIGWVIVLANLCALLFRARAVQAVLVAGAWALLAVSCTKLYRENARDHAVMDECARVVSAAKSEVLLGGSELYMRLHCPDNNRVPGMEKAVWIADLNQQLAMDHIDLQDRTVLNLGQIAGLPSSNYEQFARRNKKFLLIDYTLQSPQAWSIRLLAANGAHIMFLRAIGDYRVYAIDL